jgi:hypothetical protein
MKNNIEIVRKEILADANNATQVDSPPAIGTSPSTHYILECRVLKVNDDRNYEITQMRILDRRKNQIITEFYVNHDPAFFSWIEKDGKEYLITAEDVYGGQTVVDVQTRRMKSYSTDEDEFIWTKFFLAPDGNSIAIIGCYWGGSYSVRVYDSKDTTSLPLVQKSEFNMPDNKQSIVWSDNENFEIV